MEKAQAILLASFGAVQPDVRRYCLDALADEVARTFPDYTVRQAYTSAVIRQRLAASGIFMPSLPEALLQLKAEGFHKVLVQPTHLTAGEEYENKVCRAVDQAREAFADLRLGCPVFSTGRQPRGNDAGVAALIDGVSLRSGEAMVFMGHGSPHHHNPVYEILQDCMASRQLPVYIGVLEPTDTPSFETVLHCLQRDGYRQVYLRPLLLTGGYHVMEDMAGDTPASWKSRLKAAGIVVRVSRQGLAERPDFRKLYLDHIRDLL